MRSAETARARGARRTGGDRRDAARRAGRSRARRSGRARAHPARRAPGPRRGVPRAAGPARGGPLRRAAPARGTRLRPSPARVAGGGDRPRRRIIAVAVVRLARADPAEHLVNECVGRCDQRRGDDRERERVVLGRCRLGGARLDRERRWFQGRVAGEPHREGPDPGARPAAASRPRHHAVGAARTAGLARPDRRGRSGGVQRDRRRARGRAQLACERGGRRPGVCHVLAAGADRAAAGRRSTACRGCVTRGC